MIQEFFTSPTKITPSIEQLLRKMNAEYDPEIIPVSVEPYAMPLNCYNNVDEKVRRDGGKVHYGWAILHGTFLMEAERHAVWENDNGDLIDITPREGVKFTTTMFVSDNDFVYEGQLVDNIRQNLTSNAVVDDFIRVCETLEMFYMLGEREDDFRIILPPEFKPFLDKYQMTKDTLYAFLLNHGNPKSVCGCPKGVKHNVKYSECHGRIIKAEVNKDRQLLEGYRRTIS